MSPLPLALAWLPASSTWEGDRAPIPPPPPELLQEVGPFEGPLDGELVACTVELAEGLPLAADGQPLLSARLVDAGFLRQESAGIGPTLRLGSPAIQLAEGQYLHIELRVSTAHDALSDRLSGVYTGSMPMALEGLWSRAECGVVPRDRVQAELQRTLEQLDRALAEQGEQGLDLGSLQLGWREPVEVEAALDRAAGLVGWDAPQVQAGLRALEASRHDFEQRALRGISEAELPHRALLSQGGAEVGPVECRLLGYHLRHRTRPVDGIRSRCRLVVQVPTDDAVVVALFADGRTMSAEQAPLRGEGVALPLRRGEVPVAVYVEERWLGLP